MEHLFTSSFELIRPVIVTDNGGAVSETLTLVKTIKGYNQSLSGDKQKQYSKDTYTANNILYTNTDPDIAVTDRMRDLSDYRMYQIRAINKKENPQGSLSFYEIVLEIILTPENLEPGIDLPDYEGVIEGGNF